MIIIEYENAQSREWFWAFFVEINSNTYLENCVKLVIFA